MQPRPEDAAARSEQGMWLAPSLVVAGCLCWLLFMTAPLAESDVYRYVAVTLVLFGLYRYCTVSPRLPLSGLAWLCTGWGVYAAVRFLYIYLATPGHPVGATDWLYVFPLLFPALGTALIPFRKYIERIVAVFFTLALILLLSTTQFGRILAGETVKPLIHHNQIHGAIGCGFIAIGAFYWFMHYSAKGFASSWLARFVAVAVPLVLFLCLFNIYGSKSKGVWLAMALTLPVMFLSLLSYMSRRTGAILAVALAVFLVVGVYAVWDNLWATAGPTFLAALAIIDNALRGNLGEVVVSAIESGKVPFSMNERLQLWYNGWQVFSAAPLFGSGNLWLVYWKQSRYPNIGYTLIHNGYLEILVRHGIFGFTVFTVMLGAFLRLVYSARHARLIGRSAFLCYVVMIFYFLLTILSNSNNSLALGESFFLLTAAVAFFCQELLEKHRLGSQPSSDPALGM